MHDESKERGRTCSGRPVSSEVTEEIGDNFGDFFENVEFFLTRSRKNLKIFFGDNVSSPITGVRV